MFKDPFAPKKRKRTLTAADKKRIAAKQDWKCRECKRTLPARYHIDHIKEFSSGGSDKPSNLQALCPNCHAEKTEHDRHKKKLKKIKEKEAKEKNPFGTTGLFGSSSTTKMPSLNDALFGKPKRKKSKKDQFDFGF